MAEALGAIASGIGIVTFAFQIGKTSIELKRLCSDIHDAQENVEALADEVQLFAGLLAQFGHAAVDSESPISAQCLRSCECLNWNLDQLVKDFQQALRKGKLRGGFRVLRKRSKVKSLKEALERAKSSLSLALLLNLRNTSAHTVREIRTIVEAGFETLQAGTETTTPPLQTMETSSNVAEDRALTIQSATKPDDDFCFPKKNRVNKKRVGFSFKTPTWWLGKVYIFTKYQSYSGWDFSFRTYIVMPLSSPIFEYSMEGNVQALQKLFQCKQASPFVVSEYGFTPLFYAVSWAKLDLVRFLLDSGADMNFSGGRSTNFEYAWKNRAYYREGNREFEKASEVRELLLRHPDVDIFDSYEMQKYLPNCEAGFAEYHALQKQFYFFADENNDSESQAGALWFGAHSVDSFWLVLGNRPLERSHFDSPRHGPRLMWHIAFHVTRYHWAGSRCRFQDRQGWRDILKQCVRLNAHLITLKYRQSLCVGLIRHALRDWKDSLSDLIANATTILRAWVTELEEAGVNLLEYGELEHGILIKNPTPYEAMKWTWSTIPKIWRARCRIISFSYAREISGWSIWFSWPLDEWAGEFWNWVENPELFMPGSWVDDDPWYEHGEFFEQRGYLSSVIESISSEAY